jgi:hypothetical protein
LNIWKYQKTKYHIKACRPIASEEDTYIVKHILMTPQNQTSACKVLNYQLLSQWRSLQDRIWRWGARNQGLKDDCRWFRKNLHNSLTRVLTNTTLSIETSFKVRTHMLTNWTLDDDALSS